MTTITDKVKLDDDRVGVVKFVGEINKKEGIFFGLEITKGAGLNGGNVGNVIYFPCRRNQGVFVKEAKIARSKPGGEDVLRVTYGTRLDVPDKGVGVVKYVGYPEFRPEQIYYGVELEARRGRNDGKVNGKFYFRTAPGHGIFLNQEKISQCTILEGTTEVDDVDAKGADEDGGDEDAGDLATEAKDDGAATEPPAEEPVTEEPATEEPATEEPAAEEPPAQDDESKETVPCELGDGFVVDDDKRGLVRFVGEDRNTRALGVGLWYGVRLVEPRGNCDGTYKGTKFFKCPAGYGVMVQARRITRKLTEEEVDFDFSQDDEPTPEELARHAAMEEMRQKKKQIKAFRAKFREIDTDGSLTIEMDEFERLMAETTGAGPEEAERLFYEIDITQSGAISFAEFDGWFQKKQGTTNIGADDDEKVDEATSMMAQALADDIQDDVNEDAANELAQEDAEAAAEEAAVEEAAAEEAAAEEAVAEEAAEEPAAEDAPPEEPAVEDADAEEAVEEPAAEDAGAEEAVAEEADAADADDAADAPEE